MKWKYVNGFTFTVVMYSLFDIHIHIHALFETRCLSIDNPKPDVDFLRMKFSIPVGTRLRLAHIRSAKKLHDYFVLSLVECSNIIGSEGPKVKHQLLDFPSFPRDLSLYDCLDGRDAQRLETCDDFWNLHNSKWQWLSLCRNLIGGESTTSHTSVIDINY